MFQFFLIYAIVSYILDFFKYIEIKFNNISTFGIGDAILFLNSFVSSLYENSFKCENISVGN